MAFSISQGSIPARTALCIYRESDLEEKIKNMRQAGFQVDVKRGLLNSSEILAYLEEFYPNGVDYLYWDLHGSLLWANWGEVDEKLGEAERLTVRKICRAVKEGGVFVYNTTAQQRDFHRQRFRFLARSCCPLVLCINTRTLDQDNDSWVQALFSQNVDKKAPRKEALKLAFELCDFGWMRAILLQGRVDAASLDIDSIPQDVQERFLLNATQFSFPNSLDWLSDEPLQRVITFSDPAFKEVAALLFQSEKISAPVIEQALRAFIENKCPQSVAAILRTGKISPEVVISFLVQPLDAWILWMLYDHIFNRIDQFPQEELDDALGKAFFYQATEGFWGAVGLQSATASIEMCRKLLQSTRVSGEQLDAAITANQRLLESGSRGDVRNRVENMLRFLKTVKAEIESSICPDFDFFVG